MTEGNILIFPGSTTIEVPARQAVAEFLELTIDRQISTVMIIAEDDDSNMVVYGNRTNRDLLVALAERAKLVFIKGYGDE